MIYATVTLDNVLLVDKSYDVTFTPAVSGITDRVASPETVTILAGQTTVTFTLPGSTTTCWTVDDTSEASVPSSVTILAGTNLADFLITGVDDSLVDGTQCVLVSATSGFGNASQSIDVTNDDVNQPPTGLPITAKLAEENQTLTADTNDINVADDLGPFSYQWLRDGVTIAGAAGSSYVLSNVLSNADVGTRISVTASYIDGNGTAEGPLASEETEPVAPAPVWVDLAFEDFVSGFGTYTDGGGDTSIHTGSNSHQGNRSANLQDNSGVASSITLTDGLALASPEYTKLKVEFWFRAVTFESNEDFWLQYFDGANWQTICTWRRGVEFQNGEFNFASVEISDQDYAFAANAKIRIMADASGNNDNVYIDEIRISAR